PPARRSPSSHPLSRGSANCSHRRPRRRLRSPPPRRRWSRRASRYPHVLQPPTTRRVDPMKNAEYPETAGRVPSDDVMVPSSPGESTTPSDGACAQSRPAAPVTSPDGRLTSWAAEELNAWYNERLRDAD